VGHERAQFRAVLGSGPEDPATGIRAGGLAWTDGRIAYRLKRPWPDGRTELVMPPVAFLRRLSGIIPFLRGAFGDIQRHLRTGPQGPREAARARARV